MRKIYLFILITLLFSATTQAQIVINEIQSANASTFLDEDSSYSDWIELYNTGTTNVDLNGYHLSDGANYQKWTFPSITIPSQQHLLVFASNKDRYTYMNHWEAAVKANDSWSYKVADAATSTSLWATTPSLDATWIPGPGPIGYGYAAATSTVPIGTNCFYMRKTFTVTSAAKADIMQAALLIDFDDAFVAYLNGHEIARSNIAGTPSYNTSATSVRTPVYLYGYLLRNYVLDQATLNSYLVVGDNILAIEVHNKTTTSNMYVNPYFLVGIHDFATFYSPAPSWFYLPNTYLHTNFSIDATNGENITLTDANNVLVDQINTGYLYADASLARVPDGSTNWRKTYKVTPMLANSCPCGDGFTNKPTANLPPGFYTGPQHVTLSPSNSGSIFSVHYTLNGDNPKVTDPIYTAPVLIDSTRVLRARVYTSDSSLLPGPPLTATYFINESSPLPIVSLSTDYSSLWDWNTGIYVMGPHANPNYPYFNANFQEDWQKQGHVEYFNPTTQGGNQMFSVDIFMGINGNYSRAKDQKSFAIETKSSLDSNSFNLKLFTDRNFTTNKRFITRSSGSDNLYCHFRGEYFQKLFSKTNNDCEATRPACQLFLNGKYWGVYHIAEKSDKNYLADNFGVNPDSVDFIKHQGEDFPQSGNLNAFHDMATFFQSSSTDLSITSQYNTAKQYWDLNNLMDYYIAEIFIENEDWISVAYNTVTHLNDVWTNNIKLWRPQRPNALWRYNLHDVDQGGRRDKYAHLPNFLSQAINPGDVIQNNNYSVILRKFVANADFKNKFINRYCDLLNTVLLPSQTIPLVDTFKNEIAPVMQREITRWSNAGSYIHNLQNWNDSITGFKNFMISRPDSARLEIRNTFTNCISNIKLTVDVDNKLAGKIKISTLLPDSLPWSGYYFNGNSVPVTAVPNPGYIFDHWQPNHLFSSPNYTGSASWPFYTDDTMKAVFGTAPLLTISELNYKSDPSLDTKDWIELHNIGTAPIPIGNYKIYKPNSGETYTIPSGTTLAGGAYIVFYENANFFQSSYPGVTNAKGPLNFSFGDYGDEIQIVNPSGSIVLDFTYSSDSITWPNCAAGYGRTLELQSNTLYINNPANWSCGCILGSPGTGHVPCPETLLFNEINYNSSSDVALDMKDWVELHNKGAVPVDLSNWVFKDGSDLHSFVIPSGTTIAPNGYLVIAKDTTFLTAAIGNPNINIKMVGNISFGLSSAGDVIRLYTPGGIIYQSVAYKSNGLWPSGANGGGYTLELNPGLSDANPNMGTSWFTGCIKGSPGFPYTFPCANYGIKEYNTQENYKVYPNPANTDVTIEWNTINNEDMNFQLLDLQGRLLTEVSMKGKNKITVNRNGLQSGIYIFRIMNNHTVTGAGKLLFE